MTRGTVNVRLRPIKLAFLVNPTDRESLLKAIKINTFLWGGMYNPIIPTYKRISSKWKTFPYEKDLSAKSVVSGYLDNFDPDHVVPMGECVGYNLGIGHRAKIDDVSNILGSIEENGVPNYGIGLFEVLNYLIETELKFERRNRLDVCVPRFGTNFHIFLASVFGEFTENIDTIFWKNFAGPLEAEKTDCFISNYAGLLDPQTIFLRRMTQFYIDSRGYSEQCIFFLDATKSLDVMDYWNLRAIGWNVLPIPKQFAQSDETMQLARDFISENYVPDYSNPDIYHRTTILRSRSISEDEQRHFSDSLDMPRSDETHKDKTVLRASYPRMWNEWARVPDHVECCELMVDTDEHDISINEETTRFKTLDPKFISFHYAGYNASRFANEIDLRLYGDKGLRAEVIPEAEVELARAIDKFNFLDWRISKKGLIYLSHHSNNTISLSLPQAEEIFTRWMKLKGWTVELSAPGRIAKQMILQLGGIEGTGILAYEGIIKLLGKMSSYDDILKKLLNDIAELQKSLQKQGFLTETHDVEAFVKNLKEIQPQLDGDKRPMLESTVRTEIHKIANNAFDSERIDCSKIRKQLAEDLAKSLREQLIDANVFQLGLGVQCPECTKRSWYSVKDANYELQCPKCTARFSFPQSLEGTEWEYRTLGPFSTSNRADGAYTVLLTLRFFSGFSLLNGATTPLMSFTAEKDGMKPLEADLALFFQESKFRNSKTEVIFAECKSFNSFREKDVDRMTDLGKAFPGAILVFAKLRESLSDEEIAILCPLVNRSRKNRKNNRPFNPVLILTGKELFWKSAFSEWWKERASLRMAVNPREGMLELCDFTQQTNLGIDSWDRWLDEQYGEHPKRRIRTTWWTSSGGTQHDQSV